MSLVYNKSGAEIAFEIAEAYMQPGIRSQVERRNPQGKQAFFSLYELFYELTTLEVCPMSLPQPIYA